MFLIVPLVLTLFYQIQSSLIIFAPPLLAPNAHIEIGVDAASVGIITSLIYLTSVLSAYFAGWLLTRISPKSLSHLCILLSSIGILTMSIPNPYIICLGALIIGLGYGPITPASSAILNEVTPNRIRALIFSIKQSGVPIGGAIAGILVPGFILISDWKATIFLISFFGLVLISLSFLINFKVEKNISLEKKINFISPIIYVLQNKKLRELGFSSFTYSGMQMCLGSYLVLTLIQKYDFNLEKAGYFLSVAMIAGIVARPMAGIISDKISNARLVLAFIGIVMSICSGLIFFIGDLDIFFLTIFCATFGASAVGWNGVYLSEVARIAENKMAGAATGACLSMTYLGVVVLPIIFFLSYMIFRKYEISFLCLSIVTFTRAILFLKR